MKKIYTFNFNVGGFKIVINVVADCIKYASEKAFERCAEHVGDNYRVNALRGDYLVSVELNGKVDIV